MTSTVQAQDVVYSQYQKLDFRDGNFASYTGYFPDFGSRIEPANDTIDPAAIYQFVVPSVKLYTDTVFISASISGSPGSLLC